MKNKFKYLEAIVFDPKSWDVEECPNHPLRRNEVVYYLGEIPNIQGHIAVAKYTGLVVPMVHPEDFRKAKDSEL